MEYQRVTKSAQKGQSKTPSSPLHQTSLNHIAVHPPLELQRTVGNQAVLNMLSSQKMQIDTTTQTLREPRFSHDFSHIPIYSTQTAVPQAKLKDNQSGDIYEQEADRVAEQVMCMRQPNQSNQQDAVSHNTDAVPDSVSNNSSGGNALDPEVRQFFEPRFGHSFANIRVHTDRLANESARSLRARAYTLGEHISFASGEYQPSTHEGRRLLAHELSHVVQQSPVPKYISHHTPIVSLSKAPSHRVQRKLTATGDAAGFRSLANAVIAVQYQVEVSPTGEISLSNTNVQGPPTPEAQVLIDVLRRVINDRGTTSIEFIHGTTSTRASDARVLGGSFFQSKIDLDDEAVVGTQESIGLGQGATAGALLSHEIEEQFCKQQLHQNFDEAHEAALAVEAQAVGANRVVTERNIPGGEEVTYTYTYPDGHVVVLKFDLVNGNRTNIRRLVRP